MKKCYWLIILLCTQLIMSCSAVAITLGTDVIITVGNEQYNMSSALPFSSIKLSPTSIIFNSTAFYITSTNAINISLRYITNDFAGAVDEERVMAFDANTSAGNVAFTFSNYPIGVQYNIKRDGVNITTPLVDAFGQISFTNAVWTEREFEITEYSPSTAGAGINTSNLLTDPITTILSVFTDLLGSGFYLIPVSVIAGALLIQKNYDPVPMSLFMITSGILLSSGSVFAGYGEMAQAYVIFAGLGIASLFISFYLGRR